MQFYSVCLVIEESKTKNQKKHFTEELTIYCNWVSNMIKIHMIFAKRKGIKN